MEKKMRTGARADKLLSRMESWTSACAGPREDRHSLPSGNLLPGRDPLALRGHKALAMASLGAVQQRGCCELQELRRQGLGVLGCDNEPEPVAAGVAGCRDQGSAKPVADEGEAAELAGGPEEEAEGEAEEMEW